MKTIILPLPPSLNNIYGNLPKFLRGFKKGGGRYKVSAYRKWEANARRATLDLPEWKVEGPVRVCIDLPVKMRGDVDNRIKPVLDFLVKSQRIDDDKNVQQLSVGKFWDQPKTCRVQVEAMPNG